MITTIRNRFLEMRLLKYVNAALMTVVALGLSLVFSPFIESSPLLFFVGSVTLSAWIGGFGPGLLATVLAVVSVHNYLTDTQDTLFLAPSDYIQLVVFGLVALLISWTENHRRQSEYRLRETRDELDAILNGVSDGITVQDRDGNVVYANEAAATLLGFPNTHAMINTPLPNIQRRYELFSTNLEPLDYSALPRHIVFETGQKQTITFKQRFVDTGTEQWVALTTSPIVELDSKQVRLVVNIIQDVTIQQQNEQLRKENSQFLQQLLNSLPISVVVMSKLGVISEVNQPALDLAQSQKNAIIGQPFDTVWKNASGSPDGLRMMIALASAGEHTRHDVKIGSSPDTARYVDLMISSMKDGDGQITRLIASMVDITERKEREHEIVQLTRRLREQRNRLDNIIANIPGIVFEGTGAPTNGQQTITLISKYAQHMLGYEPEAWEDDPWFLKNRIHPDDLAHTVACTTDIYESGGSGSVEFRMIAKDGRILDVESHSSIILDENGMPIGACGVIMDITERKQAQMELSHANAQLEDQHRRLNNIISNVPGAVYETVIDVEANALRTTFMSDYAEKMLGYTPEEWQSNPQFWREVVVHPDDWNNIHQRAIEVAEGNGSGSAQFRCIRKDGTIIDTEASFNFVLQNQEVTSFGVLTDITARKQFEDKIAHLSYKLKQQHERLESIVANVPGIVYEVAETPRDRQQRVVYLSPYAEKMLGYSMKDMLSVPNIFHEIMHPEDVEPAIADAAKLYEERQTGSIQYRVKTQEDQTLHLESYGSVVLDDNDRPIGAIGVVMDITQRKEAEQQLERYMDELHRSNQELEQFAYVASHDLQEPLRKIKSYLQLIERRYADQLDDDGKEFITYAVDGATRMRALISDLLAYSRVQRNQGQLASIDLNAVVTNVLDTLELKIAKSKATVNYQHLPIIDGNQQQMTQLFQNLLSNALKFRRDVPPVIAVNCEAVGDMWMFCVRDNGIGIDPEQTDRIFTIFQRLHQREAYPGTGIGLAICKRVVENHGGQIWVESQLGIGSTFYFTLPMRQEDNEQATNTPG